MASKNTRSAALFEDLSNVEFETSEDVEVIDKFNHMNLKEELMRGIFAYGKKVYINCSNMLTQTLQVSKSLLLFNSVRLNPLLKEEM